ncbi:MAG: hypothetical protein R2875_18585 [Desulfobacterales bacterium]
MRNWHLSTGMGFYQQALSAGRSFPAHCPALQYRLEKTAKKGSP